MPGHKVTPSDVTKIRRPSGFVDTGCDEARVDKVEVIRREGKRSVQIVDLCEFISARILKKVLVRHERKTKRTVSS